MRIGNYRLWSISRPDWLDCISKASAYDLRMYLNLYLRNDGWDELTTIKVAQPRCDSERVETSILKLKLTRNLFCKIKKKNRYLDGYSRGMLCIVVVIIVRSYVQYFVLVRLYVYKD